MYQKTDRINFNLEPELKRMIDRYVKERKKQLLGRNYSMAEFIREAILAKLDQHPKMKGE